MTSFVLPRGNPGDPVLIHGPDRTPIGYRQLDVLTADLARHWSAAGLTAGDVVAIRMHTTAESVIAVLAGLRLGCVLVPQDPALDDRQARSRIDRAGARSLVVGPDDQVGGLDDGPVWTVRLDSNDPPAVRSAGGAPPRHVGRAPGLTVDDVFVMFTSATTGAPKMVPWTRRNLSTALDAVADADALTEADGTVAVMPLLHGHGLVAGLPTTLHTGGRVLLPAAGRFCAHNFWDDVRTVRATWYTAVPTIHRILLDRADAEFPGPGSVGLPFIRSCSAPLGAAVARRIEQTFGAPVVGAGELRHTVGTPACFGFADWNGRGLTGVARWLVVFAPLAGGSVIQHPDDVRLLQSAQVRRDAGTDAGARRAHRRRPARTDGATRVIRRRDTRKDGVR